MTESGEEGMALKERKCTMIVLSRHHQATVYAVVRQGMPKEEAARMRQRLFERLSNACVVEVLKKGREIYAATGEFPAITWVVFDAMPLCHCGHPLTSHGWAHRPVEDARGATSYLIAPVLRCSACQKADKAARASGEGRVQYTHRVMLPQAVPFSRYDSDVFERLLTDNPDCTVYFGEQYIAKLRQTFVEWTRVCLFAWKGQAAVSVEAAITQVKAVWEKATGKATGWYAWLKQRWLKTSNLAL